MYELVRSRPGLDHCRDHHEPVCRLFLSRSGRIDAWIVGKATVACSPSTQKVA